MNRIIFVGAFAGFAAAIPAVYQSNPDTFHRLLGRTGIHGAAPAAAPVVVEPAPRLAAAVSGRKARIEGDASGHFVTDFTLNGREVRALVDTGATAVAMNVSTARRIGISLSPADFVHAVTTANGRAKAATARIDRIEIGPIRQRNVEAIVLEDSALSGTLIGMSFLRRLSKVEVVNGALVMQE